jgi:hypothetical protein
VAAGTEIPAASIPLTVELGLTISVVGLPSRHSLSTRSAAASSSYCAMTSRTKAHYRMMTCCPWHRTSRLGRRTAGDAVTRRCRCETRAGSGCNAPITFDLDGTCEDGCDSGCRSSDHPTWRRWWSSPQVARRCDRHTTP